VLLGQPACQIKRLQVKSLRLCGTGDLGQIGPALRARDDVLVESAGRQAALWRPLDGGAGRSLRPEKVADLERGQLGCASHVRSRRENPAGNLVPLSSRPPRGSPPPLELQQLHGMEHLDRRLVVAHVLADLEAAADVAAHGPVRAGVLRSAALIRPSFGGFRWGCTRFVDAALPAAHPASKPLREAAHGI